MIDSKEASRVLLIWVCIAFLAGFTIGYPFGYWKGEHQMVHCIAEPNKPTVCKRITDQEARELVEGWHRQ